MYKNLEKIGFYTLSNRRAETSSIDTPLWRCEILLTDSCNFKCPYCRGLRNDCKGIVPYEDAKACLDLWIKDGLRNVRFSGGEPTLYPHLSDLVQDAMFGNVKRIAISTNGSQTIDYYMDLIDCGVNDFSISLDSCCASVNDKMTGTDNLFSRIVNNIKILSQITYVTVGVVFTEENIKEAINTLYFIADLGVSDIRIIPSAQYNKTIFAKRDELQKIISDFTEFPILTYRLSNIIEQLPVRRLKEYDSSSCRLCLDDMAVASGKYGLKHFPCIIYLREGGDAIGNVGPNMRKERLEWMKNHNPKTDPICSKNCLDVCSFYNRKAQLER